MIGIKDSRPESERRPRVLLWVLGSLAALLLFLGSIALATVDYLTLHIQYPEARDRYIASGMPWTKDEVNKVRLDPRQNAAPTLLKIIASEAVQNPGDPPPIKGLWEGKDMVSIASYLAPAQEVLDQLKPLRHLQCQWDSDWDRGAEETLIDFRGSRSLVKLLCSRMELRSAQGDVRGALDDLDSAVTLVRHFGEANTLIGHLVNLSQRTILLDQVRRAASYHNQDSAVLKAFAESVKKLGQHQALEPIWRGEAYFTLAALRNHSIPDLIRSQSDEALLAALEDDEPQKADPALLVRSGDPKWWINRSYSVPLLHGWAEVGETFLKKGDSLEAMEEVCRLMEMRGRSAGGQSASLAKALFSGFEAASNGSLKGAAETAATEAVLTLAAMRARDPKTLKALPEGLIPLDPFTGQPMKVEVTGQDIKVWSVGQDRRDNGGITLAESNRMAGRLQGFESDEGPEFDLVSQFPWRLPRRVKAPDSENL